MAKGFSAASAAGCISSAESISTRWLLPRSVLCIWRCNERQIRKVIACGEKVADWWLDILEEQGINPDSIPIETHAEMNQQELPTQEHPRFGHYPLTTEGEGTGAGVSPPREVFH